MLSDTDLCNLILAEASGKTFQSHSQETASGLLDIISRLRQHGLSVIDIIEWGPKLVTMFQQLAPHIQEVQVRIRAIVDIVVNTFRR